MKIVGIIFPMMVFAFIVGQWTLLAVAVELTPVLSAIGGFVAGSAGYQLAMVVRRDWIRS